MKIRQVGSSTGVLDGRQHLTTFLINDCVAVDAGCLGWISPVSLQKQVRHVFLSHCHIDHIASLPVFLDNVYSSGVECPQVYANEHTLESLQGDIFNERVWPDLIRLSEKETPFLRLQVLEDEVTVKVAGLEITPIRVNHVVPTHGFLIQDETTAVLIVSDTGPTEKIWEIANATPQLGAIFLECSFPDSMESLASRTRHLSPRLFLREVRKYRGPARIIAVHIKAAHYETVTRELQKLNLPHFRIGGNDFEITLPES